MTHPHEALSAFVDGELTGDECRDVEQHLRECAACHDLAQDLRAIDRAASAVAPPAVPADLARRIRARLDAAAGDAAAADAIPAPTPAPQPAAARPTQPEKFWRPWMPLAAAASLCVAVLLWKAWPERLPYRADRDQPVIAENTAPRENPTVPPAPAAGGDSSDAKKESDVRRPEEKRKDAVDQPAATGREKEELKALGYLAGKPTAKIDGGALRDVAQMAPAAAVAEPQSSSLLRYRAAPSPIRAEPYLIRLLEDRLLAVESGSYSCVVQVSEEDAAQIATLIKESASAAKAATAPGNQESSGATIPSASPEARRVLLGMVRERYRPALEARCGPLPQ